MKFSTIAIPAALALLSKANADQTGASPDVNHPDFKPFDKSSLSSDSFFEQFDSEDWANLWKISKAKRDEEFTYNGRWSVEEPVVFPSFKGDKGLVLKTPAAHHAIHANFPTTFDNKDNTLVLQYEVKLQEGLKCGGAYLKLLSAEGLPNDSNEFNNDTPYQIMFGPDKCGTTNKIHLIIRRKDQHTGEYEEKHLAVPPLARAVKTSTLYTLIIKPDQDFEIRINGETVKAGNLVDDDTLLPGLNPPKEVYDENDTKPEDWDDRPVIPDPNQLTKPEDWDEFAPYTIPDPNAVKPESWDENAQEYIEDPEAEKPDYWDDEEDGEWIAPTILNPECLEHGCGKWEPEQIINPGYKGKWVQPTIENPNYKGEWEPKKIPNPNYYEDLSPSDLEPIGGLGFELWSIENNILFDNIYLGHSINEAELIGNETFNPKYEIEQKEVLALAPKAKEADKPNQNLFDDDEYADDFLTTIVAYANQFVANGFDYLTDFLASPISTLSSKPFEGGAYAFVFVLVSSLVLGIWSVIISSITGGSSAPSSSTISKEANPAPKEAAPIVSEKVEIIEDETSTGVSQSETKATKRT
ncbi:Calnexin [Wickerhamomyces ciferrii]|uniref:Calnexin n=1 Tax=Wickerhamomyces ciferrii (strain ATCC 14091 / BCRC 22168 / CBS 111 / JCM 3599 / NBRC 0793 / NRRL Y-1031 F-60-10) TaxID=1206466 RepID=K0KU85_WICCF|nr:Calnexin [Wickerhamomyces ciferrii]CCH44989.1 Calnexin [Wickerhamomyces ciferrii]